MTNRKSTKRDLQREKEILSKPIRSDGVGEDPAIQALVSEEYATMPDAQIVDISLALNQLIRGQASILENIDSNSEEIARLKAKFAKYDEDARRWETDRDKWLEEQRQKGERLKLKGRALEKVKENAAITHAEAMQQVRAKASTRRLRLEQKLASEPKVPIRDPGIPIMVRRGKTAKMMLETESINIGHKVYSFPPGVEVEVPLTVAKHYEEKKRLRQMVQDRKQSIQIEPDGTMNKSHEQHNRVQSMKDVNEMYKTHTMPYMLR